MDRRRIKRWTIAAVVFLGAIILLLVVAAAYILHRPDTLRPLAIYLLSAPDRRIEISRFEFETSPTRVILEGLVIKDPAGQVDLERLEAWPDLDESTAERPVFHRVELTGLDFEAARPAGDSGQPPDLSYLTWLMAAKEAVVERINVKLKLGERTFTLNEASLEIGPGQGASRNLTARGRVSWTDAVTGYSAAGVAEAKGTIQPGPLLTAEIEMTETQALSPWLKGRFFGRTAVVLDSESLSLNDLSVEFPEAEPALAFPGQWPKWPIKVSGSLKMGLTGSEPDLVLKSLTAGDWLTVQGRFSGPDFEAMSGRFEGSIIRVEDIMPVLRPLLPERYRGVNANGEMPFTADIKHTDGRPVLSVAFFPKSLQIQDEQFRADLAGSIEIAGGPEGPFGLGGRLLVNGDFSVPPWSVKGFILGVPLSGSLLAPQIKGWRLLVPAGGIFMDKEAIPWGEAAVTGDLAVDKGFTINPLNIEIESLGSLHGTFSYKDQGLNLEASGEDLAAGPLLNVLAAAGLSVKGWQGQGRVGLNLKLAPAFEPEKETHRLDADVTFKGLGFSSPDGGTMGQGLSGSLKVETRLSDPLQIKASLSIPRGEFLYGTVYLDFGQRNLSAEGTGSPAGPGVIKDFGLNGRLGNLGQVSASGQLIRRAQDWAFLGRLKATKVDLGPVFETFVRQPLSAARPDLGELEVKGSGELDLNVSSRAGGTGLGGRVIIRSGALIKKGEPPWLEGFNLNLPLEYVLGDGVPAGSSKKSPETGRFSLARLRTGGIDLSNLDFPVTLTPNHLTLDGDLSIPFYGGALKLSRLQVDEPLSSRFSLSVQAGIENLDLAKLPTGDIALKGRLQGRPWTVTFSQDRLTVDGRLEGTLFGGPLVVENIWVKNPLNPGRLIAADLKAERVDLDGLSLALGVGRITGRVNIDLKGFQMVHKLPVAFDLTVRSVPEEGVKQRVSVEAINSISVVGTGANLAGLGINMFKTLFSNLPYKEIGFECRLKNDVFTIQGLVLEDGVEYLVRRPALMGVNVINANPNNRIGFSEMVDRIKRVTEDRPAEEGDR